MDNSVIYHIEQELGCNITHQRMVGGGCIARTSIVTTNDNRSFFLKQGLSGEAFQKEANGLNELHKAKAIRTPKIILVANNFLLLEHIKEGVKKADFYEAFGQALANLHQHTDESYGFYENNFIGSTPQINTQNNNWIDFFFTHRLLFQYQLANKNGYCDSRLQKAFAIIERNIHSILDGSEEAPSLMHGDLWGGNYMVDDNGAVVLIDPAVYYGHREADLAMTKLFGGFTSAFYQSYNESYPLKDGYEYRENIYVLYHVMNHLNLFGISYLSHTIELMDSYR